MTLIRGPRNSRPIDAVAQRGHAAMDEQMRYAILQDRTGLTEAEQAHAQALVHEFRHLLKGTTPAREKDRNA